MTEINKILKSMQWSQNIHKSLGLNSQFLEMINAQEKINQSFSGSSMITQIAKSIQNQERVTKSFGGANMWAEIAKNIQQQKPSLNPSFSSIETIAKYTRFQAKFEIPQTTLDAISSINRKHEHLFGEISALTKALRMQSPVFGQIKDLNFALGSISGQIAAMAVQQRNWTIINDFEEVTEQAIEFSECLTDQVTEEQKREFKILLTLVSTFVKKYGIQGLLIIDIILRFAGIHQYYDFLKDKPELPTKNQVNQISVKQDSVIHFINIVNNQLRQANEYRITNRKCYVKLKPKSKTLTVSNLPKDFEIIVIQIHHKWVYVSYFDPKDNLPQTGWIMKKYLNKPKQN